MGDQLTNQAYQFIDEHKSNEGKEKGAGYFYKKSSLPPFS